MTYKAFVVNGIDFFEELDYHLDIKVNYKTL
jgi:hypothetical protein